MARYEPLDLSDQDFNHFGELTVPLQGHYDSSRLGWCYLNALQYFLNHPSDTSLWLIHGTIETPIRSPKTTPILHAWTLRRPREGDRTVYEPTLNILLGAESFDLLFAPKTFAAYNRTEVTQLMSATEHAGPWDHKSQQYERETA